jgi:hypothetical protein
MLCFQSASRGYGGGRGQLFARIFRCLLTGSMITAASMAHAKSAAPVISGAPATSVLATKYYWFQARATDADRDPLTFSIKNRPGWARFEPLTGRLYGKPTSQDVGTYRNVTISVTDGHTRVDLRPFTINVIGIIQRAAAISGLPPASVTLGQRYAFRPKVTTSSEQRMVFSIRNKPWWLTFDSATGSLQGTPGTTGLGTYRNVLLSVNDGHSTATLPAFSISVTALNDSHTDSVTLDWTPPVQNTDSSTLTDLAGYHIYYGKGPYSLTQKIDIRQMGLTRYVLDGLAAGTWYFAVTAYNAHGSESQLSRPVSTVIP